MRLLLVHTHPIDTLGGAELSLRSHVASAPSGVEIDVIHPDTNVSLADYDTVVLSNMRPDGGRGEAEEYRSAREWIRRLQGYRGHLLKLEHDNHPCTYRDARGIDFSSNVWKPCDCKSPIRRTYQKLFNLCDTIIFLSPLQRRAINHMIQIKGPRQVEVASPVDFGLFRIIKPFEERKHAALITGDPIRVAPDAAALAEAEGYPVEHLDYLSAPYEKMPEILNQYKAVVIAPVMLHAFGRLVTEAMACGCRVITNDRVGAVSWPDPVAASRTSDATFWAFVSDRPDSPNPRRLARNYFWKRGLK